MNKIEFITKLGVTIREIVNLSLQPLRDKFTELEARFNSLPTPKDGCDGKDAIFDATARDKIVAEVIQAIVVPAGEKGADGKDADQEVIVAEVLRQIPIPKDGKDGRDGVDGRNVDLQHIAKLVGEIPVPKDGRDGEVGAPGKDGERGEQGASGKDGERGEQGVSAFEIARGGGFAGTEKEWLELLRGKDGRDGERGAPGERGRDGRDGAQGERGEKGADGRDGRDGEPGKDALEIKLLRDLDETRSYPKNTYAIYKRALLYAKRVTGPLTLGVEAAGWEILLDNPVMQVSIGEDLRTVTFSTTSLDGTRNDVVQKWPIPLDRGVWKPGNYEKGDMVTRDGSLWIAQRDTSAIPGESPADWRLSVKRGRDGKDNPTNGEPRNIGHKTVRLR